MKTGVGRILNIADEAKSLELIGKRVNLIGTIIEKDIAGGFKNLVLDDGTGRIMIGLFEENDRLLEKLEIGSFIMVIGRMREYLGDRYIVAEIIKQLGDKNWAVVRSLELRLEKLKNMKIQNYDEIKAKITGLIKKRDTGNGVVIDEIIGDVNIKDVDNIISKMLEQGELFQLRPGVIKVME